MQWGNVSPWKVVDGDIVKLHNTNRCLLFFPDDAGWPDGCARPKVSGLDRHLAELVPIHSWYDQSTEKAQPFDTVLVLANERNVRTLASSRNDPVQLQASTGRAWTSQLHRHIAGRDDCVRCRMQDIQTPQFACGEGAIAIDDQADTSDAALPFLSAGSGLMLVAALQHLQMGNFGLDRTNRWTWDFRNPLRMHSSGYCNCKDSCAIVLPARARRRIAAKTCWLDASWSVT